jgi:muramoyltetrapeptide carboxypeptidase
MVSIHFRRPRRAFSVSTLLACAALTALTACAKAAPTVSPSKAPPPKNSPPIPSAPRADGMVWPAMLQPGDTIMFVAPAGDLDRDRMLRARDRLVARGYKVKMRDDLFAREGYLAGSDERRAGELMQAFLDPEVDAIFPGTGGYGTMRILDRLDYEQIRRHPKMMVGFSDITALHAALNVRAGLITFHSPSPMWGLGSDEPLEPFTTDYFFRAIEHDQQPQAGYLIEVPAEPREGRNAMPQPSAFGRGKARGRLVGGNLSMLSAIEGTPYAVDTRDAILLIEDTREAPYRIDRMLRQLQLAGKLATLRGAVLGQFTRNYDREDETRDPDPRFTVDGVLEQYFGNLGIPVLRNYPVGHYPQNATLPLGGEVEIDADAATLRVLPR